MEEGSCSSGYHDGGNGSCTSDTGPCSAGSSATGKSGLCCADGYRDGGDRVCVPGGSCSQGYVENTEGDCDLPSPKTPDAPELEVPDLVTAGSSYQAKVKNPVGTSAYAWTVEGGTLAATAGDTVSVTAGSAGTVIVSCVETNQAGASSPAGTATSTIVSAPAAPVIAASAFVTAGTAGHVASVDPQGSSTYAWTIEGGTITGDATGPSIVFEATGSAIELSCSVTNAAGDSALGTKTISVVPPPVEPVIAAPGFTTEGTVGLLASIEPQSGCTYSWEIAGGTIAGDATGTSIVFDAETAGTIELTCTVTNVAGDSVAAAREVSVVPAPVMPVIAASGFATAGTAGHPASTEPQAGCIYSWEIVGGTIAGDATGTSIAFEAETAGTIELTCTVTNAAGDSAVGTKAISVVPPPIAPTVVAPGVVTAGTAGHLASVEAQAGCTYSWEIAGGTIAGDATGTSIAFEAETAGTIELICTVTNAAGDSELGTKTISVVLPPVEPVIAAPGFVTAGTAGHLASIEAQAGCTYSWEIAGGTIVGDTTGTSIAFEAETAGTIELTCTVTNAAGDSVAGTMAISVVPPPIEPVIAAPGAVTAGTTGHLASVDAQEGCTYEWEIVGGTIVGDATGPSIVFETGTSGTIELTCTVTNAAGDSVSGTKAISVVPPPVGPVIAAPAIVTEGTAGHVASIDPQAGCTYSWAIVGGTIAGDATGTSIVFEAGSSGTIELTCTVTNAAGDSVSGAKGVSVVSPPVEPVITAPGVVTAGTTGHLASVEAQEGCTYAWEIVGGTIVGDATGPSIVFETGTSGTIELTCTVTNAAGDSVSGTGAISVVPPPVGPVIAAPGAVTEGTAGHVASIEPQAGCTYSWAIVGGTTAGDATGPSIVFDAGFSGTIELTCTVTNAAGDSVAETGAISVVPPPVVPVIAAPGIVTAGTAGHVASIDPQAGCTYSWAIMGGTIAGDATGTSIVFEAMASGILDLTCTVTNAAGDSMAGTMAISVVPPPIEPVIAAPGAVTEGTVGHLASVEIQDGCTHFWGIAGGTIVGDATGPSIVFEPVASGTIELTCTVINPAGDSVAGTKAISVVPPPVEPVVVAPGIVTAGTVGASIDAQDGCTYFWEIVGGTIVGDATGTSIVFEAETAGTIELICTVTNAAGDSVAGTKEVSVVPPPVEPAITAPGAVTAGTAGHLASIEPQSGCTYSWEIEGGSIVGDATGTSIVFDAETAGTIELTCTATNAAGDSAVGTREVSSVPVPVAPVITAPLAVVIGAEATAEVEDQPGMTYAWRIEGGEFGGSVDGSSIRFKATSMAPVTLTCTVQNEARDSIDGVKAVSVFASSYPSMLGEVATQIAGGGSHTCALTSAGGVLCWGANGAGQLGDGTTDPTSSPVEVSGLASGVVAIAAGGSHTCALTSAGGVLCWGANGAGQLGDGTTTDRSTPADVFGLESGAVAITAGGNHTCALTSEGGVLCWGYGDHGQIGTPGTHIWPTEVTGLSGGAVAIAAGGNHTCALTSAGGVRCWGLNNRGQLGDGTTTDNPSPVEASGLSSGVVAIAAGGWHTCAQTSEGGVWCWGVNAFGQLGEGTEFGTEVGSWVPVEVLGLDSGVSAITAGEAHTCAQTSEGGVRCWGRNWGDQLGDGTGAHSSVPVITSGLKSGVAAISAGGNHTCVLTSAGGVRCWGHNAAGQLGDGATVDGTALVEVSGLASGVGAIATGMEHTCAGTRGGGVWCWGANSQGQLGDGTTTRSPVPVEVSGLASDVVAMAAGLEHTCALTSAGGVRCWGGNSEDQLGGGSSAYMSSSPVAVIGLASGVEAIAAGVYRTCAVTDGGGVRCWGDNARCHFGDDNWPDCSAPVEVAELESGAVAIARGRDHTCTTTSAGGVRCWGGNAFGQLGNGTTASSATPVEVTGLASRVVAITARHFHTCAVTSAGGVWCWGWNRHGQLGDGTWTDRFVPVPVAGMESGVVAIAAGREHTCALTSEGRVWCWGRNDDFQLGDGTWLSSTTPTEVAGLASDAVAIAAGSYHTCALTNAGGVHCWGADTGIIGDGVPLLIGALTPVAIRAGQSIAFSPPATTIPNAQLSLEGFALASSGLEVSFATWTPRVCSVSGTVLKIEPNVEVGALCGVIARRPGRLGMAGKRGSIAPAPDQLRLISIVEE